MSLYYDAATVLTGEEQQGSLKSRIYSNKAGLKSKPAHLYALIAECAKYDAYLKEVVEHSQILKLEPKVTPLISLLLLHDHFFAKGGIAASSSHVLRQAVERHKARLQAEFTKARLRRKCATIEQLKTLLASEKTHHMTTSVPPRWVRVNALKSGVASQMKTTFGGYNKVDTLKEVVNAPVGRNAILVDDNIPDLIAVHPNSAVNKSEAYLNGELILQDKASCFPAYLLFGDSDDNVGDVLDACAAPGNKTTHLAAMLHQRKERKSMRRPRIHACERDPRRSKILQDMVEKAGAADVHVLAKQDFLALDPNAEQFSEVTHLLLDPSCSGSGILGREDVPQFDLPEDPRAKVPVLSNDKNPKKRKRGSVANEERVDEEEQPNASTKKDPERLAKLASLQSRVVEHAFQFPAAKRVTYSTCSIHVEENEAVVNRVLVSEVAQSRGWRVLPRQLQPEGLRKWPHRGSPPETTPQESMSLLTENVLQGCIRCYPDDEQGIMGFFVVCFTRAAFHETLEVGEEDLSKAGAKEADEWEGFSD